MAYELYIGDRMFSSWSLRGWLMFETFGLPVTTHMVGLYTGTMAADMAPLAPARLVPAVRTPEGTVIGESLAIAETLAERFPKAGHWPSDPAQRATARWLCAEMAAGFGALRETCPMQLLHRYRGYAPSEAVQRDLARIDTLWTHARSISGARTGWLFGDWSLADVFYTPVAVRILGYGLPISDDARAYCEALVDTPAMQHWRKLAHQVQYDPEPYALDLRSGPF